MGDFYWRMCNDSRICREETSPITQLGNNLGEDVDKSWIFRVYTTCMWWSESLKATFLLDSYDDFELSEPHFSYNLKI